jgi:tetratricopeptide (TPR) repeat protein
MSQNAPEPAYHLGICYLQLGKIDQAKTAFSEAIKINPKYTEAHYNIILAQSCLTRGN